jgi:hypothetical protein
MDPVNPNAEIHDTDCSDFRVAISVDEPNGFAKCQSLASIIAKEIVVFYPSIKGEIRSGATIYLPCQASR